MSRNPQTNILSDAEGLALAQSLESQAKKPRGKKGFSGFKFTNTSKTTPTPPPKTAKPKAPKTPKAPAPKPVAPKTTKTKATTTKPSAGEPSASKQSRKRKAAGDQDTAPAPRPKQKKVKVESLAKAESAVMAKGPVRAKSQVKVKSRARAEIDDLVEELIDVDEVSNMMLEAFEDMESSGEPEQTDDDTVHDLQMKPFPWTRVSQEELNRISQGEHDPYWVKEIPPTLKPGEHGYDDVNRRWHFEGDPDLLTGCGHAVDPEDNWRFKHDSEFRREFHDKYPGFLSSLHWPCGCLMPRSEDEPVSEEEE